MVFNIKMIKMNEKNIRKNRSKIIYEVINYINQSIYSSRRVFKKNFYLSELKYKFKDELKSISFVSTSYIFIHNNE